MRTHPELMKAIVLAAIVKLPVNTKRKLASQVPDRRERAEELLAASIVVALSQRS
ncbi:hypothetical protein [Erythrobacter sp.]|uniref:hypothetical protein n=1 Tax=Erythrobacter sp. TaxID=1042 RepID=UPI00311E87F7